MEQPDFGGDLTQAALYYATLGWLVFPLVPRGKKPLIRSAHRSRSCLGECGRQGHGFHDATTSHPQILRWWQRWPSANIGLRTGARFDVLDIDGPEGEAAFASARNGRDLAPHPTSRTGSGGSHHLFQPSASNRARFITAVDWRGDGGYIVAPPSIHPNGSRYEWTSSPLLEVPPSPAWLLELLCPAAASRTRGLALGRDIGGDRGNAPRRVLRLYGAYERAALNAEVQHVRAASVGQRNDTLYRAAFNLGTLVGAGRLSAEAVADALSSAALDVGLDPAEIVATVRSGIRAGYGNPRT